MRLMLQNLRFRWQEWRNHLEDGDLWPRLRKVWEGR